jgi:hypothetical protein
LRANSAQHAVRHRQRARLVLASDERARHARLQLFFERTLKHVGAEHDGGRIGVVDLSREALEGAA